jgi:hypothetical protein
MFKVTLQNGPMKGRTVTLPSNLLVHNRVIQLIDDSMLVGDSMTHHLYRCNEILKPGYYGIPECVGWSFDHVS